jgi:predicted nuclease of restriction endonuclease-like RecB superfamily
MLSAEQSLIEYDFHRRTAHPDRLTRSKHRHYLGCAQRLLDWYAQGGGQTRQQLHRGVERICQTLADCPTRRITAFCKLLDEVSVYASQSGGQAAKLRKRVFELAAPRHPLVETADSLFASEERSVKHDIARQLGMTWEQIDAALFADVIEFQRLESFVGYPDPVAFLARYNVAQTQAALYRAYRLVVRSREDHKLILRYAKLARLMHAIRRLPDGSYQFNFDGPASALRLSTRYGVAMARFLPGLLSCRSWQATAQLVHRRGMHFRLDLSSEDGLSSPVEAAPEFDSQVEQQLWEAWQQGDQSGWQLGREQDILHSGQHVLTPDFTLWHPDGRRYLLEIVGYWTPEYLAAKDKSVRTFQESPLILAISKQLKFEPPPTSLPPLIFDRQLNPQQLVAYLEQLPSVSSPQPPS